jgi:hypothetical protein
VQGKDLSEAELQRIIETYDLDSNSVFDEVLCMSIHICFSSTYR